MPDDFLDKELGKEEALEHTAQAGGAAKSRVEELLEQIGQTVTHLAENSSQMAADIAELKLQRVAEGVPHTAREGVNDTIDSVGAAGNVGVKAFDVPLAASEDVIHDAAETVKAADADVKRARKIFKRRK
jgi:hypothetical protein